MTLVNAERFPALSALTKEVLSHWPEHEKYLNKSFGDRDDEFLQHSEMLAELIAKLSTAIDGGLEKLAIDYRFLGEKIVLPEELYFRRNKKYRLSKFEDALRTVYNDREFMTRYMNGLLLSDVIWPNHCLGLKHYATKFLPSIEAKGQLLEIGPGHGLLLYLATQSQMIGDVSAWDVSDASISMSKHALDVLGAPHPVSFEKKNIFDPSILASENANLFDAVVLSEVLEHLEEPKKAIEVLYHICKPGGKVWINVPANSPAPDHLFLVSEPQEAERLVKDVGFEVVDTAFLPMTGTTLDRAIKLKLTITCIVVGEKPKLS